MNKSIFCAWNICMYTEKLSCVSDVYVSVTLFPLHHQISSQVLRSSTPTGLWWTFERPTTCLLATGSSLTTRARGEVSSQHDMHPAAPCHQVVAVFCVNVEVRLLQNLTRLELLKEHFWKMALGLSIKRSCIHISKICNIRKCVKQDRQLKAFIIVAKSPKQPTYFTLLVFIRVPNTKRHSYGLT